MHNALSTIVP